MPVEWVAEWAWNTHSLNESLYLCALVVVQSLRLGHPTFARIHRDCSQDCVGRTIETFVDSQDKVSKIWQASRL
jgi:hypothetical protein